MYRNYSIKNEFLSTFKSDSSLQNTIQKPLLKILSIDALDRLYHHVQNSSGHTFVDKILTAMNVTMHVQDQDLEKIPRTGSCIVVANHPFGGIEGILIAAVLQKIRPDCRIMANYFLSFIPELRDLFIFVDPFDRKDSKAKNIAPLKQAFGHLKNNGVLVLFPSGAVSHLFLTKGMICDPPWQGNMGRFIEKANVPVLPVFFKGANNLSFQTIGLIHPLLRTLMLPRQLTNKHNMHFSISIGSMVSAQKLRKYSNSDAMLHYLRKRTYNLANRYSIKNGDGDIDSNAYQCVADTIDPGILAEEYKNVPADQVLFRHRKQSVFYANAQQIPNLMREIGREREIAFRDVKEGTGLHCDIDRYDAHYLHLVAWDEEANCIIGAYRMGLSDLILRDHGKEGLYTYSLFKLKDSYLNQIQPAVELGRSFIVKKYQRQINSLFLLWRGIGEFLVRNNGYRYLFGPVSISRSYQTSSQRLLLDYLLKYHRNDKHYKQVKPRNFKMKILKNSKMKECAATEFPELEDMISDIENDSTGVPILIRQYLKLGAEFVAFNIDAQFSNVIDGLIVVDLCQADEKTLSRYMGLEGLQRYLASHKKLHTRLPKPGNPGHPLSRKAGTPR
jgi:putative hemolysin